MKRFLVLQSDFGMADGAVSAMQGVALSVDPSLALYNLTHDIEPYNVFEASYRLFQAVEYWREGTVFVSVVDPGVGSDRKSVVALTEGGHYIVTPDNGTLTHIKKFIGLREVRQIDESLHRRQNTELSYTFHGRDIYANTGAKLASGAIALKDVGPELDASSILELPTGNVVFENGAVEGSVDILDVRFGSLWTNITYDDFQKLNAKYGDYIETTIRNGSTLVYKNSILYGRSFADVGIGAPILYLNSLYRMGVAINQGSFARAYSIGTGLHWRIRLQKHAEIR